MEKIIAKAKRLARKNNEDYFIVLEDGYHTTDEDGLYTFWNGAKVLATVLPNGEIYLN
jgi:hypothetical protein